jgi:hypothetical protein
MGFNTSPLAGRTVNVKLYSVRTNTLDMKERHRPQPDFYLAMTGPRDTTGNSRGRSRPCVIRDVFLFETAPLLQRLAHVKIGVATSIKEREWASARIYPVDAGASASLSLTTEQIDAIKLLSGIAITSPPECAPELRELTSVRPE